MVFLQILLWSTVSVGFFIGLMSIPSEAEQRAAVRRRLVMLGVIQHKRLSEEVMRGFAALNEAVQKAGISFKELERNIRALQARR